MSPKPLEKLDEDPVLLAFERAPVVSQDVDAAELALLAARETELADGSAPALSSADFARAVVPPR